MHARTTSISTTWSDQVKYEHTSWMESIWEDKGEYAVQDWMEDGRVNAPYQLPGVSDVLGPASVLDDLQAKCNADDTLDEGGPLLAERLLEVVGREEHMLDRLLNVRSECQTLILFPIPIRLVEFGHDLG